MIVQRIVDLKKGDINETISNKCVMKCTNKTVNDELGNENEQLKETKKKSLKRELNGITYSLSHLLVRV